MRFVGLLTSVIADYVFGSGLPRAIDKVPFYTALKKLRDHLRGDLPGKPGGEG